MDWTGGLDWWTGLVDWTGGLDWRTGLVDWTGGPDWRTGLADWTLKMIFTPSNAIHLPVELHINPTALILCSYMVLEKITHKALSISEGL